MVRRNRAWTLLLGVGLTGLALTSCTGSNTQDGGSGGVDADGNPVADWSHLFSETDEGAADAEESAPVTADQVELIAALPGDVGAAPTRIDLSLGKAVFSDEQVREGLGEDTVVVIEPPVEVDVLLVATDRIQVVPKHGFAPDTRYNVRIDKLASRDGTLEAPSKEAWSTSFETPSFGFLRAAPVQEDLGSRSAVVQVVFSGPVDVDSVKGHVRIHDGQGGFLPLKGIGLGTLSNRIRLDVGTTTKLAGSGSFTIEVDRGVKLDPEVRQGVTGSGGKSGWEYDPDRPKVDVQAVHLVEGTSRYSVEIICDDAASEGYKRWTWLRHVQRSFRVSPRCLPTEDTIAEHIVVNPPVPFNVVPTRGGFRLLGDFQQGGLTVELRPGLETVDGGRLAVGKTRDLIVPALEPTVAFTTQGRYLPRDAWSSLPLQHRNVGELEVEIRHIPERNLMFWLTADDEAVTPRVSELVAKQTVPVRGKSDERVTTWIDVDSMLPDPERGVYEVRVSGGGASATARLLMTDLNLVAKGNGVSEEDSLHVWALGMHDGANQSGVEVKAVRESGEVVASCTTTAAGCDLKVPEDPLQDEAPVAILAKRGDDMTYLVFNELKTDVTESKVQGEAYTSERPYRASLYTERGVYRPGEIAHVAGIVRGEDRVAPPPGMPIDLELRDPRGKLLRTLSTTANDAGMFTMDVPFADYARTGSYAVTAKAGTKQLGQVTLAVEEFVPERMEVNAAIEGAGFLASDRVEVEADARYLFGGSAADHRFEVSCRLVPSTFSPQENSGYTYGDDSAGGRTVELGRVDGTLDKDAEGALLCPSLDHAGGFTGAAKLIADVAVFEAGSGRTTTDTATVAVHPADHYVGIRTGTQKIEAGKPVMVEGVLVDWQGRLDTKTREVRLDLEQLDSEWGYFFDEENGHERWQRIQRAMPGTTERVQVKDGRFKVTFTPSTDGEAFRITARTDHARSAFEVQGTQRYWWWDEGEERADATPRPLKPTDVALSAPEDIEVGEKTEVTFTAPFKGRALVTLETDEILRSEWLAVDAGPQKWSFTLGEFVDNVYVSVLVVKDPHLESKQAFLPDRAFGVQSMKVRPAEFTGKLAMDVPEEVRSDSTLEVKLDLGQGKGTRYVTVAAVDEGILSLTDFESPDPFTALFPTRALGVKTWETVGWSLHLQPPGSSSSTGGDAESAGGGRVQMVKPVSLWSGVVEVPESGKVTVPFEVPRYRGKLRVMAVSTGKKELATAEAHVVVRDPVVVQTTLPRFLIHGDVAEIPVFVTNVSGKARSVKLRLDSEVLGGVLTDPMGREQEALTFTGGKSTEVQLADGESTTAVFRVRTNVRAGAIRLAVVADSGDVVVTEELEVPVEAEGPRTRSIETIKLTDGMVDLDPYLSGWQPGTEHTSVWITSNPYGASFGHLKYVVRYPYGCIEQTTSSTRPLLYVGNLLEASDPELADSEKIADMVQHGVDRLMNMQTPSGGFAYWMGGSEPTPWGTAYATHMLLDAQEAGFPVPQKNLDDAVAYLERETPNHEDAVDTYHDSPGGAPYMHYVLARAGKGNKKRMLQLVSQLGTPDSGAEQEALYLLQAGLYLAGDRRFEKELRNPDVTPISDERHNDWTFYSDRRRRAFQLSVYADLFGSEGTTAVAQGRLVADSLANQPSRYYTTQEISWGMTGLGKIIEKGAKDHKVSMIADGKPVKADAWSDKGELTWSLWRASELGDVDLKVDAKTDGAVYAVVQSEGVRTDARWIYGGKGLQVSRTYLDQDGDTINLDDVELGDVVYAKVTLENTSNDRIQNIALVDRFPAGWEIENPRLGRGGSADWVDYDVVWNTDNLNLRDDRLEVFGALNRGQEVEVVYVMRAVTSGTFALPPVEAEAMYDPRIWTRAPGGTVTIHGNWQGKYL